MSRRLPDFSIIPIRANDPPSESELRAMVESLQRTIASQRYQLKLENEQARRRNLELDALHYVWCTGGCASGQHRWCEASEVSDEMIATAERQLERLKARKGAQKR